MKNYTITRNEEHNGIEIAFDSIPNSATRVALKGLGFKWHSVKKVWYGKQEHETAVLQLLGGEQTAETHCTTLDKNSDLWQAYRLEIQKVYPQNLRMQNYCIENVSDLLQLDNGLIYAFEKPSIRKDFCFGFGQNGVTDKKSYNNALSMSHHASKSEQYFIDENLAEITKTIKSLEKGAKAFARRSYTRFDGVKLCDIYVPTWQQRLDENEFWLNAAEQQCYLNKLKSEKAKFEKRLKTYLKRYGLNKVHSWTYLID